MANDVPENWSYHLSLESANFVLHVKFYNITPHSVNG